MALSRTATLVAVSLAAVCAHREGAGSQSHAAMASEHLLAAASAAGVSASELYEAATHGMEMSEACKESAGGSNSKDSMEKMRDCVDFIAKKAQQTKITRDRSAKANANYANDIVLAKKLLAYLAKRTQEQEQRFKEIKETQKQKKTEIMALLSRRTMANRPGHPLMAQDYFSAERAAMQGGQIPPESLMAMYSREMPMATQAAAAASPAQLAQAAQWANMAAMYTATGQSFGMPMPPVAAPAKASLVGRHPSQLKVDTTPSPQMDLQAQLDRQAESLESTEEGDLMFQPA